MRLAPHARALTIILAVAHLAGARPASGQATSYVPTSDPAYADLDALVGAGLVREVISGERPYSRAAFRRFVGEARARASSAGAAPRLREALDRLALRFADGRAGVRIGEARGELTAAASPPRSARTGVGSDGDLDADLNPLLQENEGRRLADGGTAALEASAIATAGIFAVEIAPRATLAVAREDAHVASDATLTRAYGRVVVGPVALDVGRNAVSVGHGLTGGPLLSQNARGLDMVRLGADRPVRLPGILGGLGLWQASFGLADLGSARDTPGSALALMRLSGRPGANVEFGLSYLNIQGGEGAPSAPFHRRVHDLFFFWRDGGVLQISDKVVGADLRLAIPDAGASLNVNFLTTDDRGRFQQPAGGYWEDAVWQVGADVVGLGGEGRADVAVQWTHAGPRAHTHGQFTSGVTLDRRVLGNALGPNATGVTGRVTWNATASRIRVTGSWERYSGDDFYWALIPGGGEWDYEWFRASDNPDELRARVVAEWLRFEGWLGLETTVRVGYEHVTRFAYGDEGRHNAMAQWMLRRVF